MTYIIVDFEATCCNKGSVARNEMEIIEIGAVALGDNGPEVLAEFQHFIRPVRNPVLTDFCTELTSITQDMLDAVGEFPAVIEQFQKWLNGFNEPLFCSWGNYDKNQLQQDCAYHSVDYPFDQRHINIKQRFAHNMELKKALGLGQALKAVGLSFNGTAHRGIDDARNMADLSAYIFSADDLV